jgi:hypothetical protein
MASLAVAGQVRPIPDDTDSLEKSFRRVAITDRHGYALDARLRGHYVYMAS